MECWTESSCRHCRRQAFWLYSGAKIVSLRIPVKPSTCSGDVVHLSERSDASTGILPQVVGMGNGESVLRRDSPSRLSR